MATTNFLFTELSGSSAAGYTSINNVVQSIDATLNSSGRILPNGLSTTSGYTLVWSGGVLTTGQLTDAGIANNAITTVKILNGAVTSDKILDGTIAITDLAFDPATQTELNTAVSNASTALSNHEADTTSIHGITDTSTLALKSGNTYTGTHDYTGATISVPTATAGDNDTSAASTAFVTTAITNAATGGVQITASGIADDAVTADKLRDSASVDADRAVTTNHIRDLGVTSAKMASNYPGHLVVANTAARPASPTLGQMIYQTDTDEYLKYVTYGGSNRWMHVTPKSNRSIIINGDFSVAQRGTSNALVSVNPGYLTVDRWSCLQASTADGTMSQLTTGLPTQASNGITFRTGLRIGRNIGATTTGTINLQTAFETVDSIKLQGKQVTLSFWAKAGANYSGGTLSSQVVTGTSTDQSLASMSSWIGYNVPLNPLSTLTTNWVLYSYTGTISATAAQIGLHFRYTPSATPAGSDDYLYITGVQLEAGSAPSEFEFHEYGDELRRCQRYYYRLTQGTSGSQNSFGLGFATGTGSGQVLVNFPVTMRVGPSSTVETTGTPSNYRLWGTSGYLTCSQVPNITSQPQPHETLVQFTVTSSTLTTGHATHGSSAIGVAAYLGFSAEL